MVIDDEKARELRDKISPFLMRLHGLHRSEAYYKIIVDDLLTMFNLNIYAIGEMYNLHGAVEVFRDLGYELDDGGHFVISEESLNMNTACQNIVDLIKKSKPKNRSNGNGRRNISRGNCHVQSYFEGGNAYGFSASSSEAFRTSMRIAQSSISGRQMKQSSSAFGYSQPINRQMEEFGRMTSSAFGNRQRANQQMRKFGRMGSFAFGSSQPVDHQTGESSGITSSDHQQEPRSDSKVPDDQNVKELDLSSNSDHQLRFTRALRRQKMGKMAPPKPIIAPKSGQENIAESAEKPKTADQVNVQDEVAINSPTVQSELPLAVPILPFFDADNDSVFADDEGVPSTPPMMADIADFIRIFNQQPVLELPLIHTRDHMVAKVEQFLDENSDIIEFTQKVEAQEYSAEFIYFCKKPHTKKYARARILDIRQEYAYVFFVDYLIGAVVLLSDCRHFPNYPDLLFVPSYLRAVMF